VEEEDEEYKMTNKNITNKLRNDEKRELEANEIGEIVNLAMDILNKKGSVVIGPTENRENAIKISEYLGKRIDAKKYEILFPRVGLKQEWYYVSVFSKDTVIQPHNY